MPAGDAHRATGKQPAPTFRSIASSNAGSKRRRAIACPRSAGRSTLELVGRTFGLLCFAGGLRGEAVTLAQAFAARGVPFRLESIEQADVARAYERPLVLVRPDGHVAWRGSHVEHAGQVVDTVRGAA